MKLDVATSAQARVLGSNAYIHAQFSSSREASAETFQMVYAGNIGTKNITAPRDKAE